MIILEIFEIGRIADSAVYFLFLQVSTISSFLFLCSTRVFFTEVKWGGCPESEGVLKVTAVLD